MNLQGTPVKTRAKDGKERQAPPPLALGEHPADRLEAVVHDVGVAVP
jgi:hypothetical protein